MLEAKRKEGESRYRNYLLVLLAVILAFNNVDRLALGLALQSIKTEFGATDTELGVLSGIAFAAFYSVLGIPIGRWADRGNRVTIIALTTALWSVMVTLCGSARSLLQLLLVRMAVAVGEAGCIPPAYSLIGESFSRAERPRAVASYLLGGSLSLVIGYFIAGWINQLYGWRVMFVLLGVPGLVLAPLAWFTLRDPRTNGARTRQLPNYGASHGTLDVCRALWNNRTFRHVLLAFCVNSFFGYGIAQWQPSFFIRSYRFATGDLGLWLAITYGTAGIIGTYCGGRLASRYAPGNERLQLRVLAILWVGFSALSAGAYLTQDPHASFAYIGAGTLGVSLGSGPMFATAQTVVPEHMRAVSVSILFLLANLIGLGLGPLSVGALSDVLQPILGQEALRYALLAMCPGYLIGGWQLWRAGETVRADSELALNEVNDAQAECTAIGLGPGAEPKNMYHARMGAD